MILWNTLHITNFEVCVYPWLLFESFFRICQYNGLRNLSWSLYNILLLLSAWRKYYSNSIWKSPYWSNRNIKPASDDPDGKVNYLYNSLGDILRNIISWNMRDYLSSMADTWRRFVFILKIIVLRSISCELNFSISVYVFFMLRRKPFSINNN